MKEIIILDPNVAAGHRYYTAGTVEDWRNQIARYCQNNTRLTLVVSEAFAAPLLYLVKALNIGIHLRGLSSVGKTTALYTAGSVWGGGGGEGNTQGFVQSWRATANGLELQCALHNDAILCLDEIALVNEREIGDIVYCLGNGVGKRRATRDIRSRPVITFRLCFLSCGERSLREMMEGAGKRIKGGQESRLIDIPADVGEGHGIFEVLHGFSDGAALSRHLTEASQRCYGTPSRTFTEYLESHFEEATERAKQLRTEFVERLKLKEHQAPPEFYRIADAFGLIAAGGRMATDLGITGWDRDAAFRATQNCFEDWLQQNRGGRFLAHDIQSGLRAVSAFLSRYPHRFQNLKPAADARPIPIHDRAGFYKETDEDPFNPEKLLKDEEDTYYSIRIYYIGRDVFEKEICREYDYRNIALELQKHLLLVTNGGDTRLTYDLRIPGEGKDRFFAVLSTVCEKY